MVIARGKKIRIEKFSIEGNRQSVARRIGLPPYDQTFAGFHDGNGILGAGVEDLEIANVSLRQMPAMAIICDGRIVGQGSPAEMVGNLKGRIWRKTIDKAELKDHQARYRVISTRLFAGRTVIHIIADSDPGDGFAAVQGDLEDVYFSTLSQHRKAA